MCWMTRLAEIAFFVLGQDRYEQALDDYKMSVDDAIALMEGLINGFAESNDLPALDLCATDVETLGPQLKKIVDDIKARDWPDAKADALAIVLNAPKDLKDCTAVPDSPDGPRLKKWM